VTAPGFLAAVALVAAFVIASLLTRPVARRRGLGLVHPGPVWLVLAAVFLGLGSAVLAVSGESSGPALYVAGSVVAFGLGLRASDARAVRRGDTGTSPPTGSGAATREVASGKADAVPPSGARHWVPFALAALAIGAIAPTLIRSGIPFLTVDVTGSRTELVGLPIQLVRVGLPALAALLMFDILRAGDRRRRLLAVGAVLAIAGFSVILASRYLIAEFAAALFIAWLLAGRRVPARVGVAVVAAGIVAFGGIQVLRAYDQARGNEVGFAVARSVNRIVLVQPRTIAALQRVIPAEEPYFLGLTWLRRLGPLLGRDDIPNLGYWIYPEVVSGAQETAGYAAPGLIGEAWANFGPAGLALFVALGALAERLGAIVARRRETAVDIAAGALAILFLARTHALGLGGLAILIALVVVWRILAGPLAGLGGNARDAIAWRLPPGRAG
jgi:hypothetical protein